MRFLGTAVIAAAVLSATAAQAALSPIQFPIAAQNDSGERGTATLLQGSKGVIVKLRLSGYAEGVDQPAHIHKGSCAKLDPKPTYPLKIVHDGLSETTIENTTLAELQNGNWAINVHKSTKEIPVYVACGTIPKK